MMIFDDSLSAVDTETDAQNPAGTAQRSQGLTNIIISHRITTLSQADCIFVLGDGRVVVSGTHEELIRGSACTPTSTAYGRLGEGRAQRALWPDQRAIMQ